MINKALLLIEENIEEADFFGKIDNSTIEKCENHLGVLLPLSYKEFILKYGSGDILGIEIYGLVGNIIENEKGIPSTVWITMNSRDDQHIKLPKKYIIIGVTGYGPYYVIDTSELNNNEAPVYIWDIGDNRKKIADSFGQFIYEEIKNML